MLSPELLTRVLDQLVHGLDDEGNTPYEAFRTLEMVSGEDMHALLVTEFFVTWTPDQERMVDLYNDAVAFLTDNGAPGTAVATCDPSNEFFLIDCVFDRMWPASRKMQDRIMPSLRYAIRTFNADALQILIKHPEITWNAGQWTEVHILGSSNICTSSRSYRRKYQETLQLVSQLPISRIYLRDVLQLLYFTLNVTAMPGFARAMLAPFKDFQLEEPVAFRRILQSYNKKNTIPVKELEPDVLRLYMYNWYVQGKRADQFGIENTEFTYETHPIHLLCDEKDSSPHRRYILVREEQYVSRFIQDCCESRVLSELQRTLLVELSARCMRPGFLENASHADRREVRTDIAQILGLGFDDRRIITKDFEFQDSDEEAPDMLHGDSSDSDSDSSDSSDSDSD